MKTPAGLLLTLVLLIGITGTVYADSYTLTYLPTSDLYINDGSGSAFTVSGVSTATASDIFNSATLTIIIDKPLFSDWTASDFSAWFDSARGQTPSWTESGTGITTVLFDSIPHDQVSFTTVSNVAAFGNDTWYSPNLVMGAAYYGTRLLTYPYMDEAILTIDYTAVPEPASLLLVGAGMSCLGLLGSRKKDLRI